MKFGVCDFSRFAVTDWRLRRWRFCGFGAYDSYSKIVRYFTLSATCKIYCERRSKGLGTVTLCKRSLF